MPAMPNRYITGANFAHGKLDAAGRTGKSMSDLTKLDLLTLDYSGKVKALDTIAQELLNYQIEFSDVAARYTKLKATIDILKSVKSSLQSSIRAESGNGF
jgi:hypothetical protein